MADVIKTIGVGKDYTTMKIYVDTYLKSASGFINDNEIAECYGTVAETVAPVPHIDALKSTPSKRLIMRAGDNPHEGRWDATKDRVTFAFGNGYGLQEYYMTIEDMQFDVPYAGATLHIWTVGAGELIVRRCIIRGGKCFDAALTGGHADAVIRIYRNYLIGEGAGGASTQRGMALVSWHLLSTDSEIYNNTADDFGSGKAFQIANKILNLKNNIVSNTTGENYQQVGNTIHSNNISADASSPDASYRNKTVTFVDAGAGDLHLDASDTEAKDNGANLGSPFDFDIDNEQAGDLWSIGADEITAVAAAASHFVIKSQLLSKSCFNALDSSLEVFCVGN